MHASCCVPDLAPLVLLRYFGLLVLPPAELHVLPYALLVLLVQDDEGSLEGEAWQIDDELFHATTYITPKHKVEQSGQLWPDKIKQGDLVRLQSIRLVLIILVASLSHQVTW